MVTATDFETLADFQAAYPIYRNPESGKWGWRRANGEPNIESAIDKSEAIASKVRDRAFSRYKGRYEELANEQPDPDPTCEGKYEFDTYRSVYLFNNLCGGGWVASFEALYLRSPNVIRICNVPSGFSDADIARRANNSIFSTFERVRFWFDELATDMSPNCIILD